MGRSRAQVNVGNECDDNELEQCRRASAQAATRADAVINSQPPWKAVMGQSLCFLDPTARAVKLRSKQPVILAASPSRVIRTRTWRPYSILSSILRSGGTSAIAILRDAGLTFFGLAGRANFHSHLPRYRLRSTPAPGDRAWSFSAGRWSVNPEAALGPAGRTVAAMRTHEMCGTAAQGQADARTRRIES